jgi:uncharacterized repeat protein (TIGR01451 family)
VVLAALSLAGAARVSATSFKQPGFSETAVFTELTSPTAVRFLPDGSVLVAEKSGLLKVFPNMSTNTYTVVADLSTEVHNFWDRGLLGLAIDPNFASNNYVYVLYTYDAPIGGTPPTWGPGDGTSDPCPSPPGPTTDGCVVSARLSRLTAVGTNWTASEFPLINDWCQQFPSHSIGALNFGADGYLYVSAGEGANFNTTDWGQFGGSVGSPTPKNPCGDPPAGVGGNESPPTAEGGALRSQSPQRAAAEPRLLNGSLLRVDPATGAGVSGNPFFSSTDANARRIIGYGFRNPFRFTIKPGTNDVWIADVGWNTWEEIDRVPDLTSARDFGWPCYEGAGHQSAYDSAHLNICENLYAAGTATAPFFAYNHGDHVVANDGCPTGGSAVAGLAFYTGTGNYPPGYAGALFFSDYTRQCVWVMLPGVGGDPDPTNIIPFASSVGSGADGAGAVDVQLGPDGNVYYVDYANGKITRFVYGLNAIAVATSPTAGPLPLTVSFDGTGSVPAQPGDTLSFAWDLDGDGPFDDSTLSQPSFTYDVGGVYTVRLKVTDQRGASSVSAPITIYAGNTPPTPTILTPPSSLTYRVGDVIGFSGQATDSQDGTIPASGLSWQVIIHHCPSNCHTHIYETYSGVAGGSFAAPDHDYPSFLEIVLTATDSGGLQASTSVFLQPQTVNLTFQSAPSGLQLSVGSFTGAAPFTRTLIIGSQNTVTAPSPQGTYPVVWEWLSWSDGGAESHTVTSPASYAIYTANYVSRADLSIAMAADPDPACAGQPLTYTIDVANAGLSQAVFVSVVDTLPAGATLVSAAGNGWTCAGSVAVTCTMPTLDVTSAAPITIVITPPAAPTADNSAVVGSFTVDTNGANNSAALSTPIHPTPATPSISAPSSAVVGATGLIASTASHGGSTYAWTLAGGAIASGQGTSQVTFDAGPPGTTMVLQVVETSASCPSAPGTARVQVDFSDVPPSSIFHDDVDVIAGNGVTVGCGGGDYCPGAAVTRAQMAVFLLKSKFGSGHVPPPATGTLFADVHVGDFAADWIEELANLGVTAGCGGGDYCPTAPVTRAQMAVFLLKTLLGTSYTPPPATGTLFGDVRAGDFAADWIEDLYNRSITGGCQQSPLLYCPGNLNTRGQMAVFLTLTFSLE